MKRFRLFLAGIVVMAAVSGTQAAVVTDGFDFVENLVVGSQNYVQTAPVDYPESFAFISVNDLKTYAFDDVSGVQENNIDMKFYIMGGSNNATVRLYSMDGGNNTKDSEYKSGDKTQADFTVKNATRFMAVKGVDFDAATVDQLKSLSFTGTNAVNPVNEGDVIVFKTAETSKAADRLGLIKVHSIVKENETSSKGVITVSIKVVKPAKVETTGFRYGVVKVGTYGFSTGTVEGYEGIGSLLSIKDLKSYTVDEAKSNFRNVDIKLHLQGADSEPRVYSMENGDSKNSQYKDAEGNTLQSLLTAETTNATRFLAADDIDFDNVTASEIAAIDPETIGKGTIKPAAEGDVILFKTDENSTAGSKVVGVMRIDRITLVNNVNKELGCYTVSIKVLDNTESVSVPKVSNNEWSLKGKSVRILVDTGSKLNVYAAGSGQLVKTIDVVAGDVIDFSNFSGAHIVSYGGKSEKVIF